MLTLSRILVRAIKNNETASFAELNGVDPDEGNHKRLAFLFKSALLDAVILNGRGKTEPHSVARFVLALHCPSVVHFAVAMLSPINYE